MDDLLQTQIKEICELHMPEGLKELMSDITREVLRAQPTDIYGFIADYLSALLVTRDNLTIASQICTSVCECDCRPEMIKELKNIGLSDNDANKAQKVIFQHFSKKKVNEGCLLSALSRKTDVDASMFPAIIEAVRAAYLGHQAHNYNKYETSSESDDEDEVAAAAAHTLKLYRQSRPLEEEFYEMADKVQNSYHAYGVRRGHKSRPDHFGVNEVVILSSDSSFSSDVKREMEITASMNEKRMSTVSSLSLAGSLCQLPKHKPYSAHDESSLVEIEETCEKEHAHIDYTARSPHVSVVNEKKNVMVRTKRISFQNDSEEEVHPFEKQLAESHHTDEMTDEFGDYEDISGPVEEESDSMEDESDENEPDKPKTEFNYVNTMNEDTDVESDEEAESESRKNDD